MPRDRYSRPPSPSFSLTDSRSPSPVYISRPHSRSRSRSRSRPETRRVLVTTPSPSPGPPLRQRSRRHRRDSSSHSSTSSSYSRSRSRSRQRRPVAKEKKRDNAKGEALKTSLAFIGTVAAAAYAMHKAWPKGFIYGEKEDLESVKKVAKKVVKGESSPPPPRRGRDDGERHRKDTYRVEKHVLSRRRSSEMDHGMPRQNSRFVDVVEEERLVRRPSTGNRGYADGVSCMATAGSGTRMGDVRRERYCQDTRTEQGQGVGRRSSFTDERERETKRRYDEERRYRDVVVGSRGYSFGGREDYEYR